MKYKKKLFIYCCDLENYRGEGILANNFIKILKNIFTNLSIKIYTPENNLFYRKKIGQKKLNHSFFYKYLSPLLGILMIWKHHLRGDKTVYVNFLPLWNFLLFLFLPKKTILGPITGSVYHGPNGKIKTFLRKIIVQLFYKISIFFIRVKNLQCIFSTSLLFNILPDTIRSKALFNFQLYDFNFFNMCKKNIDIVYYNRNYHTKENSVHLSILKKFKKRLNIFIVGDEVAGFKNLGIISRINLIKILKKTKFTFSSAENQLSYFVLDAIACNVLVISLFSKKSYFFKKSFIILKDNYEKKLENFFFTKHINCSTSNSLKILKKNNLKIFNFIKKNIEDNIEIKKE
jgi:hypothetical protein